MEQNILEQILEGSMKPTNLSLETLRKITDEFSVDRIIGEGGFGTVYKGVLRNGSVAVKRIRSSMTIDQKLFRREVDSLMEVNHPNVVRFLGLCSHTVETPMKNPESRGYIYAEIRERLLCFEYIGNGSLDTKITDELRGLEWDKRYKIIRGICAGLHYLHMEKRILHMDLKPANILLDEHMVPKITDFGLSRPMEISHTMTKNHFVSPGYCAPENLFGGRMTIKSDMYSLGVIIIELVTGHKDISDNNNILRRWRHRWNKSMKKMPPEYHQQVIECIEIGSLCQKEDPCARPSISEIMRKIIEMESTNYHNRNANGLIVGQINQPAYWDDDMLGVDPLELQFGYHKQKQILSCSLELSNDTDGFIAYKIQTMSPLPYCIEPNNDIVKPRSKCRVDISLPIVNIDGHEAARQHSKKQHTEFVVRSIKVNEVLTSHDISDDMFDKHTTGHHVDEILVLIVPEEPGRKEVVDLPSETLKEHGSSGWADFQINYSMAQYPRGDISSRHAGTHVLRTGWADFQINYSMAQYPRGDISSRHAGTHVLRTGTRPMPTPTKPGIKNNKKGPLFEYEKKVMLELTGGDYTSNRPGLDLVAVLDISVGKHGKMDQLKIAMRFILQKLSPIDRLCVVTFSDAATKLCPLRQITEASRRDLQELIAGLKVSGYASNINDGLLTGLKVVADRKVSKGRVVAIMLMSNAWASKGDATKVIMGDVPIYTFGFGYCNHRMLSAIAAKSMGGTFSHVQDIGGGGLTMAFSQCLAGLLTVAVQNLELTVVAVRDESTIVKVAAGSYKQTHDATGSVTVSFGDLYSREVRNVIVDLLLPTIDIEHNAEILKVTYSHSSSSSAGRRQLVALETLTVWRTGVEVFEDTPLPLELQMEEVRLRTAKMIKEAAQQNLGKIQKMLEVEECDPLLRIELLELFNARQTYDPHGHAYAFSSESSHSRQRFAARGNKETMRLFTTPRMDMYLEQAKKFHDDPIMHLPSADDDVKEEVGAHTINVASREDDIRKLSLDMEDNMIPPPLADVDNKEVVDALTIDVVVSREEGIRRLSLKIEDSVPPSSADDDNKE